jgi:hypothetical protein
MNAQNPQYKAFYNPTTGQYVNANGLGVFNALTPALAPLQNQGFTNVRIK